MTDDASKLFYIKFSPKDYLGDTSHLTAAEHGVYCLCLFRCFIAGGRLPYYENAGRMARQLGLTIEEWEEAKDAVLAFFNMEEKGSGKADGYLSQKRIDREINEARKRAKNSKKAAKSRWRKTQQQQELKCSRIADAYAPALKAQCQLESESERDSESRDTEESLSDRYGEGVLGGEERGRSNKNARKKKGARSRLPPNERCYVEECENRAHLQTGVVKHCSDHIPQRGKAK